MSYYIEIRDVLEDTHVGYYVTDDEEPTPDREEATCFLNGEEAGTVCESIDFNWNGVYAVLHCA